MTDKLFRLRLFEILSSHDVAYTFDGEKVTIHNWEAVPLADKTLLITELTAGNVFQLAEEVEVV